jgi:TP901-1 family phage major tail protein
MAKSAGRLTVVSYNSTGSTYVSMGQTRTKSISLDGQMIDTTTSDSNNWTELYGGEGIKSVSISVAGLVDSDTDDALESSLIDLKLTHTIKTWKFLIDGIGTFEGYFAISTMSFDGAHDGAVGYNLTLNSSGPVTFTAAS